MVSRVSFLLLHDRLFGWARLVKLNGLDGFGWVWVGSGDSTDSSLCMRFPQAADFEQSASNFDNSRSPLGLGDSEWPLRPDVVQSLCKGKVAEQLCNDWRSMSGVLVGGT